MILRAGPHTRLRSAALADAEPVYALVEANRAHLRRWLGWVDFVRGVEQLRAFLEGVLERERGGAELHSEIVSRASSA